MMERTMARRSWTAEERAHALDTYQEHGLSAASAMTGVPKPTLHRWATQAGIDTDANTKRSTERNRAAAQVAASQRQYVAEEFRTQMVAQLAEVARRATAKELALIARGDVTLRDVVGARTRAIHDLQLLSGAATGRTETVERTPEVEAELARVIELRRRSA